MNALYRWMLRSLLACLLLALLGLGFAYFLVSRSLPNYEAQYRLPGLSGQVEITRDISAVPHIFADHAEDVYFGLGFVHAQDRLWQMTMLRRTAQGRLSELFGPRTADIDELLRRLDFYRLAQASYTVQTPETKAALTAYAAGVNAWINQVNTDAMGRGAPEFYLFEPEIALWQPADSLAILKLMALQLSSHLRNEVDRARLSLSLPAERVLDLMPDSPGAVAALDKFTALFPKGTEFAWSQSPYDPLSPVKPAGLAGASNAWAAGPERSASGGTLLANDPHLELTAPSTWYLARLGLPQGGVIGGTIPGMPLVLAGRNPHFAWGVTTAYVDDQDLYVEELNPSDPAQYLGPDGFVPFRSEDVLMRVAGEPARRLTLQWTENGPVLPAQSYDLGLITPPGHVMSLAWTALTPDDTTMSASMRIMQAQSVQDAITAGRDIIGPAQILTMVDGDHIGLQLVGKVPRRAPDHLSQGRLPSLGADPRNRWQGMWDYDTNPQFRDPEGGILGNTNNQVIDRPFPQHVAFAWGDTQRVQRWRRLMQAREVHTRESFIEAQLDTVSVPARTLLPLIGAELWYSSQAAEAGTLEAQRRVALDLLANWNGEMNEHLPEPLIYSSWLRALQARLIRDDLGRTLSQAFEKPEPLFIERVFRNVNGAAIWCDVIQTSDQESCAQMADLALNDALIWIQENSQGPLESLQWGEFHQAAHIHPVLGHSAGLSWLVNIRQSLSGSDHTLMRAATKGTGPEPFLAVHGAGFRGVYDLSDPDSSLFIIGTGQSGHLLSRHYDDLSELWRRGEYIPMSLDENLARAGSVGTTLLVPAEN